MEPKTHTRADYPYRPRQPVCVESFFASLKKERVYRSTYTTGKQALHDVSDYIGWYNHQRMHSTNDHYSPVAYENQWVRAMQALDRKWASLCTKKG
ncbi:IS3 family transposase [Thiomicrospira sp. R3]|uniref:IS3 family transposase n=1 Tax=Thiomicrospira sp. R3 TaxID=3035472 RepID=UPI00338EF534